MRKVILSFDTNREPKNDYIIVDGENYLLLEFEDYGLEAQAGRWKLDRWI